MWWMLSSFLLCWGNYDSSWPRATREYGRDGNESCARAEVCQDISMRMMIVWWLRLGKSKMFPWLTKIGLSFLMRLSTSEIDLMFVWWLRLGKSKMFPWLTKIGLPFLMRLSTSEIEEIKNWETRSISVLKFQILFPIQSKRSRSS